MIMSLYQIQLSRYQVILRVNLLLVVMIIIEKYLKRLSFIMNDKINFVIECEMTSIKI